MNKLIVLIMLMTSSAYAVEIIANNDVIKSNRISLYLDGVELWDIAPAQRADVTADFTVKCKNEIPKRVLGHDPVVEDFYPNFTHDMHTKVVRKNYSGLGTQLLCRVSMRIENQYMFFPKYSEIYTDKVEGTFELCKNLIEEIDNTPSEEPLLIRRAYYTYAKRDNGEGYYPSCQILKVLVLHR